MLHASATVDSISIHAAISFLSKCRRSNWTPMSMFKVNTMHFHLTEDQGWRIEIKKYPKLTSMGSIRTEGRWLSFGGFYTGAD